MSQTYRTYPISPYYFVASNLDVYLPATEAIVFNDISTAGITNFSLTVKNRSSTGVITQIIIYASADGVDYFPLYDNLFPDGIQSNELIHAEFYCLVHILRVTAISDEDGTLIDIYMRGTT